MAVYPGILSRRKKVSPYIAGKCHGKIFIHCSLNHRTTVKVLGSLDLGFSLLMGLNSGLGEDSPALEPSSPQNQHLPLLGVGCWARGVLPPRHFAGQLNNFPLVALGQEKILKQFNRRPSHSPPRPHCFPPHCHHLDGCRLLAQFLASDLASLHAGVSKRPLHRSTALSLVRAILELLQHH